MKRTIARMWLWTALLAFCVVFWMTAYCVTKDAWNGDPFAQAFCGAAGFVLFTFVTLWALEEVHG